MIVFFTKKCHISYFLKVGKIKMCLVLGFIFAFLSVSFFMENNILNASVNGVIALVFFALMARNIIKTKKERSNKQ